MLALPARHRNPKLAVGVFDTVVDIPELTETSFPLAVTVKLGSRKSEYREYRYHDGHFFEPMHIDLARLLRRHAEQVVDTRPFNSVSRPIMRDIARAVSNIHDPFEDLMWPKEAAYLLKSGMDTQYDPVQTIMKGSAGLQLDGEWRKQIKPKSQLAPYVEEDPMTRLKRFEDRTIEAFSDFRVLNGSVWRRTAEPCYVARMTSSTEFDNVFIGNVAPYVPSLDNREDKSWWHNLSYKAFSLKDAHLVVLSDDSYPSSLPEVELHMPDTLTADMNELEIDRCARVLSYTFSDGLSGGQRGEGFKLPSTPSMEAWTTLNDALRAYDPFDGVPDDLDDRIEQLIRSVGARETDKYLIDAETVDYAEAHVRRWSDREIGFDLRPNAEGLAL